jgi:hypothetical protein
MNAPARQGIPLRPDPLAVRQAASTSYIRAMTASALAKGSRNESAAAILRRGWPDDRDAEMVLKAASNSASLSVPAWAGLLGMTRPADFVSALAPSSCALALLQRCLEFEWPEGTQALTVPAIDVSAAKAPFVSEGNPTPVVSFTTSVSTPMVPGKVLVIVVLTREILEYSLPNAELMVKTALGESLGLSLDAALFGTAAASASTPAGLFYNISPLTASAQTIPSEAMVDDLANLYASVSAVSANHPVTLVASPKQFAALKARLYPGEFDILKCSSLPVKTVAAVASNGLASIADSVPEFVVANEMSLHMDTAPQPIGSVATTKSLFQEDVLAIRLKFKLTWTLRAPGAIAFTTGVVW